MPDESRPEPHGGAPATTDLAERDAGWDPPTPPATVRRRWPIVLSVLALVVAVLAISAAFIRLPYALIAPGDATPVEDVISIEGAPTYEMDGSVLFLTVSVSSSRPNVYTVLDGWLDDDVDVISEDDLLQGNSREEERRANEIAMTDSQLTAKAVALEELGYDVPRTGHGAQVVGIELDSPADGELEIGDVITAVDGTPVTLSEELGPLIRARPAGDPVTLTVERGGDEETITLVTRAAADGEFAGQAQLGIATQTFELEYDFPVDITIDTGKVGGPSAGLAFTLTIVDKMTPGSLTGGADVAVTGTIESDGSVGEIGGIEQKAAAAQDAGATIFVVPAAEAAEARKHSGNMDVVGVDDLDDALAALEDAGGEPVERVGVGG